MESIYDFLMKKEQSLVVLEFPSGNSNNYEFEDIDRIMELGEINFGVNFD